MGKSLCSYRLGKRWETHGIRYEWLKNLRGVLKSPHGKEVVYELLNRCGVFRISYGPGAEPADVAYLEGRRSIGLQFLDELLEAAPEATCR